jgi:hypothetical protein
MATSEFDANVTDEAGGAIPDQAGDFIGAMAAGEVHQCHCVRPVFAGDPRMSDGGLGHVRFSQLRRLT